MEIDKKLQGIQLIAQEKLQAIICSIPGKKDLIIESSLIKPLEHVCSASWLKLKGIIRIFKYDTSAIVRNEDQVQIYMIPSDLNTFQKVLLHIHEIESQQPSDPSIAIKFFHIVCVPQCFTYFQSLLEEDGLYGIVQLHKYCWDFMHIDQDLLSLETPKVFSNVFLKEETSLLPSVASSLRIIERLCGSPDMYISYGQHSESLLKMLKKLKSSNESLESKMHDKDNDFDVMLLLDRDKDYASSLLTPSIYAGLLLEIFSSKAGEIDIESGDKINPQKLQIFKLPSNKKPSEESGGSSKSSGKMQNRKQNAIRMNSLCDEIYGENRYKHFSQTSSLLRSQAKSLSMETQKLNDMKLDEMHDYVARKLPKITELKAKVLRHLNASEKVIDILGGNYRKVLSLEEDILNNVNRKRLFNEISEELLTTDGQRFNTLRLLCLLHLCSGLSGEELQIFARNYCNYFGARYLPVFEILERAGLLPNIAGEETKINLSATKLLSNIPIPKFQQTSFQANANRLKLMVANNETDPDEPKNGQKNSSCPSFVFNGLYIPLVAQISSILLKANSSEDVSSKLGMIEGLQISKKPSHQMSSLKNFSNQIDSGRDLFPLKKRNIFVYVVGGVTYAEVAACEIIANSTSSRIVVSSDCITSGSDLISGAF